MSTIPPNDNLSAALFGRTRRAVLSLLYGHTDEAFYLRHIARVAGVGLGSVQREVKRLSACGVLQRTVRGRQVFYQANPQCPIFNDLKSLVVKTVGVGDVLRSAMAPLAERIRIAAIYGSVARHEERRTSDVDILVVGEVTFAEIVAALGPAQGQLGREINPTVYPPAEFHAKLEANHHFLTTILKETLVFLIGDERELARLAGQRLADEAPNQPPRNH